MIARKAFAPLLFGAALFAFGGQIIIRNSADPDNIQPSVACSGAVTVNWIDTASYAKPCGIAINKPDEATVSNKYWVDMTSGAGTTCSMAVPCDDLSDLVGKAGMAGGPAIVYLKGTGNVDLFDDVFRGSGDADCRSAACDNWILIRTWPAGSTGCATECTATVTGNSNIASANAHHVIFDGGPDLKIKFQSDGAPGTYAFHTIDGGWVLFYRVQTYCTGSNNGVLGHAVGDSAVTPHVWFINNEFHTCRLTNDQASAVYAGPGAGGGWNDLRVINSIIRNWGGEGLEFNNRATSTTTIVEGNVLYDNGEVTCSSSGWKCRPHIVFGSQDGNPSHGIIVRNNLMWNSWSGCVWFRNTGTPAPVYYNNTCYNYNRFGPAEGADPFNPNPFGVEGGATATVRNNIFYPFTTGTDPFDPGTSYTASNNACPSGESCGTSSQVWMTGQWLSLSTASSDYLKNGASSLATDTGTTVASVVVDLLGITRPQGAAYDMGAFEWR